MIYVYIYIYILPLVCNPAVSIINPSYCIFGDLGFPVVSSVDFPFNKSIDPNVMPQMDSNH